MTTFVEYTANGSTALFPFAFAINAAVECQVLVAGILQTSGYSLRGQGTIDGGAVIFDNPPAAGLTITLRKRGDVQVSAADTAPAHLADKLVAGAGMAIDTVTDPDGAQVLRLSSTGNALDKAANLADLADKAAARANLGVYSADQTDAAIAASAAQVSDAALQKAQNLNDLADKVAARTNLDVYSKAETDTRGQVFQDAALLKTDNLAGVADKAQARTNLDVYSKAEADARDQAVKDAALLKADNLAGVADKAAARTNLDVFSKAETDTRGQVFQDAALLKADNLAGVADKAQARTNLDVYSKAETDARDQAVKDAALLKTDNLAGLADKSAARINLDVYSKAESDSRDQAVKDTALLKASNLSDVANVTTARTNLSVYSKSEVDAAVASVSPASLGVGLPGAVNLKIAVTGGTTVSMSAGSAVLGNGTGGAKMLSAVAVTIATGTVGAGGLDTGTLAAATWYAVWLIAKADGTVAGLLSTSANAPALPTGYIFKVRLGWVRTSSGAASLLGTLQLGSRVQYVYGGVNVPVLPVITSGVTSSYVPCSVTSVVPTATAKVIHLLLTPGAGGNLCFAAPNANYTYSGYGSLGVTPAPLMAFYAPSGVCYGLGSLVLESSNVYYYGFSSVNQLHCLGWEDNI